MLGMFKHPQGGGLGENHGKHEKHGKHETKKKRIALEAP